MLGRLINDNLIETQKCWMLNRMARVFFGRFPQLGHYKLITWSMDPPPLINQVFNLCKFTLPPVIYHLSSIIYHISFNSNDYNSNEKNVGLSVNFESIFINVHSRPVNHSVIAIIRPCFKCDYLLLQSILAVSMCN